MTTAVNNQTSQDVYSALGLNAPNSNATKKKNTLDQADFLRLMTEQLQHQDPLKPMDNTQMVAQMAQMSTVQGITDLNKTVKGFQESMASDQVLRGAALVGHQVLVPSEKLVLEKEDMSNDDLFNRILWGAIKGDKPYPGPTRMSALEAKVSR